VFAGAVVSADGDQVAKGENGEDANWEDVVKGLETINGVKVSVSRLSTLSHSHRKLTLIGSGLI